MYPHKQLSMFKLWNKYFYVPCLQKSKYLFLQSPQYSTNTQKNSEKLKFLLVKVNVTINRNNPLIKSKLFGSFLLCSSFHNNYFNRQYSSYLKPAKPVLKLYTKDPCPLCDEALEKLKPFLDQVILEKIDIDAPENKRFWKAYRYDIPVFYLNGKFLMKHRANIEIFNASLEEYYSQAK